MNFFLHTGDFLMSDLLEQAIIDATALKEAAVKSAENALIEKYSQEFKSTVERLLEQEQFATPTPAPAAGAAPPPAMDAAAAAPQDPNMAAAPTDPSAQAMPTDPSQAAAGALGAESAEDPLSKIPAAFADADDDELITIDFSGIKKALNEMMGVQELEEMYARGNNDTPPGAEGGKPTLAEEEDVQEEDVQEEEAPAEQTVDEELELEELSLEEEMLDEQQETAESLKQKVDSANKELAAKRTQFTSEIQGIQNKIAGLEQQLSDASKQAEKEPSEQPPNETQGIQTTISEDVEISDEELLDLAEELRVDINEDGISRGYMGSTTTEKRLQRDAELAKARDEEATEAREQEMEAMQDLLQENEQLKAFNEEMVNMLKALKEQVEQMNVSNAKLLYTNKALVNISLNERQKSQIVESISKAGSVLEAKTVYETLQNAVEGTKVEKEAPQSLREALNRAQSPFVVRKSPVNNINDMQSQRMKLLAGIKSTK
jgi:ribosomal protein S17E